MLGDPEFKGSDVLETQRGKAQLWHVGGESTYEVTRGLDGYSSSPKDTQLAISNAGVF